MTRTPDASDIHTLIANALTRSATLDANSISISVHDDEVTLRGRVRTLEERIDAARTAELAPGITIVHNHITVRS